MALRSSARLAVSLLEVQCLCEASAERVDKAKQRLQTLQSDVISEEEDSSFHIFLSKAIWLSTTD